MTTIGDIIEMHLRRSTISQEVKDKAVADYRKALTEIPVESHVEVHMEAARLIAEMNFEAVSLPIGVARHVFNLQEALKRQTKYLPESILRQLRGDDNPFVSRDKENIQ